MPIDGIDPLTLEMLKRQVQQKILPRPAQGNPSLERAMSGLDKAYPKDTVGVEIAPDWSPSMFTNQAGYAESEHPTKININSLVAALFDQPEIDRTAAHELQHIRQFRKADTDPEYKVLMNDERRSLPYSERGHEQEAAEAGSTYLSNNKLGRKPTPYDNNGPSSYSNYKIESGFFDDLDKNPMVHALINNMNK